MNPPAYLVISGAVFGLVAVFHLLHVVKGWTLVLETWPVPIWISWLGTIGPFFLCIWASGLVLPPR